MCPLQGSPQPGKQPKCFNSGFLLKSEKKAGKQFQLILPWARVLFMYTHGWLAVHGHTVKC